MNYETLSIDNPVAIMFNTKAVQNAPVTTKDFGFVNLDEAEEEYLNDPTDENFIKWFSKSFKNKN
jgi:hypothetical protein